MKTLDEVIKAMDHVEFCCTNCKLQFDCDEVECFLEDALHYLKELKDILDPLKVKKISHEITCPKCNSVIAILLPESNEPLTWDELKTMEGKPVWVEVLEATDSDFVQYRWGNGAWYIVKDFALGALAEYCQLTPNRRTWIKQSYGEYWQAYRKERG